MNTRVIITGVLLIVVLLAIYIFTRPAPIAPLPDGEQVFCTMDAKLCPDGSYVGRVAPSCDFAPCPGE